MIVTAIPATTWLPLCVMQAKPIRSARNTAVAIPAPSPNHTEPVVAETAAAANAAPSIFPSSPRSITPARSEKSPAIAANNNGVATRIVAASSKTMSV